MPVLRQGSLRPLRWLTAICHLLPDCSTAKKRGSQQNRQAPAPILGRRPAELLLPFWSGPEDLHANRRARVSRSGTLRMAAQQIGHPTQRFPFRQSLGLNSMQTGDTCLIPAVQPLQFHSIRLQNAQRRPSSPAPQSGQQNENAPATAGRVIAPLRQSERDTSVTLKDKKPPIPTRWCPGAWR
jgi:hypothetical protein